MSSGFAKLLEKSFVLGYAIPSLVFLTIVAATFGCPDTICSGSASKNAFAELTYAVIAVYILAVLLLAANYWFYRFFEGYLAPIKWLGFFTAFHKWRLETRKKQIDALTQTGSDASVLQWRLQRAYPEDPEDVLPTAFGNAIKAFELYPYDIYRIDAIGAWPRLLAVIPKDFLGFINDAKALVDLWVNLAGLALVLGTISVAVIVLGYIDHGAISQGARSGCGGLFICSTLLQLLDRIAATHPRNGISWGAVAIWSFVGSYLAYWMATPLVSGWGEQVKSAFDCFLPKLATSLGYTLPSSALSRRKSWEEFNNQVLYGVQFEHPPYAKTEKNSS